MSDTDNNITTVSPTQLQSELKDCVQLGEAAIVAGPPGGGKTDITSKVAKDLGHDLLITHPVCDEAIDYKGMPAIIDGAGGLKEGAFLPFGHLKKLIEAERPLTVLLDDVGQAHRMVQAAIMQLVLNRALNGVQVSPHVHFNLCTNRAGDRAGADAGLLEPLKSRGYIYQLKSDVHDWVKWAIKPEEEGGGGMPPVLCAFMRYKPELLNDFNPTRDMVNSPNPRCWARVGRAYKAGLGTAAKYAGAVGDGASAVWMAFERTWGKLPKIEVIVANPESAKVPEEDQLDVMYATAGCVAHHATENNIDAIMKYTRRLPSEFQGSVYKDIVNRDESLNETNAMINWVSDNNSMLFS